MRTFVFWTVTVVFITAISLAGWFALYVTTPVSGTAQVRVLIPRGAGVRRITKILGEKGIITDDVRFLVLVRLLDKVNKLRAGEFIIARGLTPLQVLQFLETAKPVSHLVTIPEGFTMEQVAQVFADRHWVDKEEFLRLCRKPSFIKKTGLTGKTLEGYLFPDTYALVRGEVNTEIIITMMVDNFKNVWKSLNKPDKLQWSRHELVTLASIVEKETGAATERATIAGVFYNRLRKGMRLQSDPTTIYGLAHFNGNLTRRDLQSKTPYNTYVIPGLPPGPICSPGRSALSAVLHPAKVPYYYFVAKNDGTHCFSTSLKQHNRAVRTYQKKRSNGQMHKK